MDDGENDFFLIGGVRNADVEESCRCLKMIQETRVEVGVLERALSKAWICKLEKNGIMTTKEENAFFGVTEDFLEFGNVGKILGFSYEISFSCVTVLFVSCGASHFDRDVVALRGDVVEVS